jgi:hypothetical protein
VNSDATGTVGLSVPRNAVFALTTTPSVIGS